METKVCKRCGREQRVDQFREYYGGRKGQYSFCKTCEKIEQRRKYLANKDAAAPDSLSESERAELSKVHELYDALSAAGRKVPVRRPDRGVTDIVDQMLADME